MKQFRVLATAAALFSFDLLLAPPCLAIPTDIILFQDTGNGITQLFNGAPIGSCSVESAGCTTTSEQGVGGTGIPTSGQGAFPINFNIFEDPSLTVLSDTFALSVQDFSSVGGTANTVVATFTSGPPITALTGTNVIDLVETGNIQTLGTVTFTDANATPIDAIEYQFVSDNLPEPSSLVLVVGLLGVIGLRRRSAGQPVSLASA
jgi:hypothetical protein